MTVRQTSIQAYHEIRDSGLLKGLQMAVYEVILQNPKLTQAEIQEWYFPQKRLDSIKPRVTELKIMGVVREVATRQCGVTGKNALIWEVVDTLPDKDALREFRESTKNVKKLLKKQTKTVENLRELIGEAIEYMEFKELDKAAKTFRGRLAGIV